MKEKLKILIVEDVETDVVLLEHQISAANILFKSKTVETEDAFIHELNTFKPNIVLSDYSLPQFDGLKALKIIQNISPGIPFILVTGSLNEETAVEIMKAGADDYVIKDHLKRIGPAIQKALEKRKEENDKITAQKTLLKNEIKYKTVLSTTMDGFYIVNNKAEIFEVNNAYSKMVGFSKEELLKMHVYDLDIADTQSDISVRMKRIISSGSDKFETRHKRKDGKIIDLEVSISYSQDDGGMFFCFMRDITERKSSDQQLRESLYYNEQIISNARVGVIVLDPEMMVVVWNPYMEEITNVSSSFVLNKSILEIFAFMEEKGSIDAIKSALNGKTTKLPDLPFDILLNGKSGWTSETYSPIRNINNEVIGVLGTVRNITLRKNAEKALKENEEKYRLLFEKMISGFALYEIIFNEKGIPSDYRILDVNPSFKRMFKFESINIIGKMAAEIMPNLEKSWNDYYSRVALTGEEITFDTFYADLDKLFNIMVFSPAPMKIAVIFNDITDQKRIESELKLSDARFKGVINSMQDLVYTLDKDKNITGLYGMWSEMYGFSEELLLGKKLTVFLSPAEAEVNDVACSCALNSEAVKYEWSLSRNEDKFYFESSLTPLYGNGNEVIGIVGVAREITDRKRSERLLLENEERYRKLVEVAPDAIILHKESKIIFINPSAIKTMGAINSDQMIGKSIYEFIHPDFSDNTNERLKLLYSGELDVLPVTEIKIIRCDGTIIDAEISTVIFSSQGEKIVQVVARDITERRKIQEALKVSEKKFRTLVENIPGIVYRCEVKIPWRMTMMSEAVEQLTGYKSSVFTANKLTFAEVVHPEDLQFVKDTISRAFDNHQQFDLEYRIIHKNGTVRWVHEVGKAAYNKKGNQDWLDGVIIDITAKKISEEIIKESQIILKATLESSADGILVVDNLGNVRLHNSRFVEMWQITEELLKTNNAIIIFNAAFEQLENPEKFSAKVKELDKSTDDDFDFLFFKDGRIFERYSSSLILENKIIGRVWSFRNITDQKLAERELRKLSRAVSQSSAGIIITDTNGIIEYANPKFTEITGFTFEEAVGNNPRILKSGQQNISLYKNLWETILSGNEWRGELYNKKKSGELYWEYISISPVKNEKGELTHFVAVKEDISARKKIEEELIKSKEEAEEANKLKSSLLANMSHEFRTPLNGILGFTQLLKDELVGKDELEMLEKITRSGKRLMNTLNSVLTLTELENENYLITQSQIDLSIFCQQIKSLYEITARDKKLELYFDIKNENIQIKCDENLLTKIVSSLVENAIKYTREGSVRILLESKVSNDNKKFAIIKIKDSGIGINLENHDIIFREFKQLSEGYRRDFEGLGLGLTLARKMANLLGGDIFVESTIGIGSAFSVVLPMDSKSGNIQVKQILLEEFSSSTVADPIFSDYKVLLVEDNPLNIEVVQRFLSKICNVSFARDGLSAIEMATENDYCLLMIDINLGQGMDGLEVLKQLKNMEKYATIPSIALTGYASDTNKRDFLSKGFSHYLAKPFEKRELVKLIKGILKLN